LNWTGWVTFNWTKDDFRTARWPIGWDSITGMTFSSSWGNTQNSTSDLYFDSLRFFRKDGSEIDGYIGLEQHLLKVDHDRKTFYDLNAPSIPTSKSHAVNIIRQNAENSIVQVLKPYTEGNFISSFTKTGKTYVINTQIETITIDPGNLESDKPCAVVRRKFFKNESTATTYLACKNISLSESKSDLSVLLYSEDEDSFISLQTSDSLPDYSSKSGTVVFNNIKVTGNKNIGIRVKSCSGFPGFTVSINGKKADVTDKKESGKCVTMTFSIKPKSFEMGDITVLLKEFVTLYFFLKKHFFLSLFIHVFYFYFYFFFHSSTPSSASHIQCSAIIFLVLFLFCFLM